MNEDYSLKSDQIKSVRKLKNRVSVKAVAKQVRPYCYEVNTVIVTIHKLFYLR